MKPTECEFCGDPATRTETFDREVPVCDKCHAGDPGGLLSPAVHVKPFTGPGKPKTPPVIKD